MLKAKFEQCFKRWKWKKIRATDTIKCWTKKEPRKNLFRKKQTTNKVPANILRGAEVKKKKLRFMFWTPKDSRKPKWNVYSSYKQRHKIGLLYLEFKLREDKYGWCNLVVKGRKTEEKRYLEASKQQPI